MVKTASVFLGSRSRAPWETGIASGKSLVLPAPARLLPLLPTVNSYRCCLYAAIPCGTAKGRGLSPPAFEVACVSRRRKYCLLELDSGASRFEILLELRSVVLRHGVLHDASGLDEVLGFLQAQAGDGADGLDDLDLLLAGGLQDDLELGLLFDRGGGGGRAGGHHDRGGGGDAELLFDGLDQLHHFHQGLRGDGVDDLLVGKGHFDYLWIFNWIGLSSCWSRSRLIGSGGFFGLGLGGSGVAATLLVGHGANRASKHARRLGQDAGQHGQCLFAGRQGRDHVDVRARIELAAERHDLRLQLVVALREFLDQPTGCAGIFLRERVQQRTSKGVLDALVVRALDGARSQRVLDNFQEHARFTGLLAHRGHLTDRGAGVLGSNQRMGLASHIGQLGDHYLLLRQIESHCTPPYELRSRLLPLAVLGRHRAVGAGDADGVRGGGLSVWLLTKNSRLAAPSAQAQASFEARIKRSRLWRRRILASRASMPDVVTR